MRKRLLALLLVCLALIITTAFGATDISGKWAGAPFYFIFKQDGNKLSGTGGPSEKEQLVSFDNGTVDGDHITFQAGSVQFDLRIVGDQLQGEMRRGDETLKMFLKRDDPSGDGAGGVQKFDVASVKRLPTPAGGVRSSMKLEPGRLICSNVSLRTLIMEAHHIKEFQLSAPDWLGSEIYDITATMPAATSQDHVIAMLQNLLDDRFGLGFHRETKELPMYSLGPAKGGLKIKEGEFGPGSTRSTPGHLTAQKITMSKFADYLANQLGSPVKDETGAKGFFDFTLEWTPDPAVSLGRPGEAATADAPGPSLLNAIQEQLGLKLETRKGPVEIFVIDHVEKIPTGN